jgi:hypothetical protein
MDLLTDSRPAVDPLGRKIRNILLLLVICVLAGRPSVAQEDQEPLQSFEVNVNGEVIPLREGDTLEIGGKSVVIHPTRLKTFRLDDLEFEYPRDFSFRYESENTFRNWTLDGNNFVIMVFEFPAKVEIDELAKEMSRKFGRKHCKISIRKIRFKNFDVVGKRIDVAMLGARVTFDMFPLPAGKSKMHVIAFQDTKTDAGKDSEEGIHTMKVVSESIRIRN